MARHTWLLLAVVLGVAVVGYVIIQSQTTSKLGTGTSTQGTLGNVASIFKSGASIFGDVEKAFPSWFGGSSSTSDTPSDAALNSYASSSGFASTPDVSA